MSASLPSFKPDLPIRAASSPPPSSPKPDPKPASTNWWAPLFAATAEMPDLEARKAGPRSRFAPGGFTEEKAKQLRRTTREGSSFHDAMYHSAIATRLAWD
ncbi:hypothetical protein BT93_F3294 [Corymbia citriodora subsp. variegata]|nr:hypothetical protein BT93_F3294 [Corymbia citriodora subsp. variegata]